ncbi:MAG: hypothetical protein IJB57_07975 [Clostridia bacterium]|nr:hypothetical protein [Clostridia bacterium]
MKIKNIITIILLCAILGGFSVYAFIKPQDAYSDAERRALDQFPELNTQTLLSGSFMKQFEDYTLDQFPLRDSFRGIKAYGEKNIFRKKDNNKIFSAAGHLSKIEYPLSYTMLDNAIAKFDKIIDKYLNESNNIFFSIIPDKNYFIAEKNGYLHLDYKEMFDYMKSKTPYMEYIDLVYTLEIGDYYYTDTHWKQENLPDTASVLAEKMGVGIPAEYTVNDVKESFYGVYCGQYALPVEPDSISYLTNETIDGFKVTIYDTGKPVESSVYDMSKITSKDPYEMFLSGAVAVQTIENPNADNDRELIIFRDSFGSSMAPLLAQGYAKTTLLDIRYVSSDMLSAFADFKNADILFMYSTIVLNSSTSFK